ncbi:5499_t:CDS:2, partial [Cetraspora pellucida]
MDFPNDVLHHINVAVVVMILKTTHGYTFEGLNNLNDTGMSDEMWVMSEKLHDILIECLRTEDSVLKFINWFFDGIRKTFGSQADINDNTLSLPDVCFQCERPYTNDKWCSSCETYLFEANFHNWSTGNVELNKLIRQSQLNSVNDQNFLKWFPFSQFKHLKDLGSGGFSSMFSARWSNDVLDGTLQQWVTNMEIQIILDYVKSHNVHLTEEDWDTIFTSLRSTRTPSSDSIYATSKKIKHVPETTSPLKKRLYQTVALKRLHNSANISSKFINEFKSYHSVLKSDRILRCFGLTQDPETSDYFLVSQYANDGDLNHYLRQNFVNIDWWQRLEILRKIVRGIKDIHDANLVHHNLHGGNILRHIENSSSKYLIADFGLYFPADATEKSLGTKIYGVLPFTAPEVLRGDPYTKAADIYSLGMLMWQFTSGLPPFLDRPYDLDLAKDICEGLRPVIIDGVPDRYIDLMKQCWDSNPNKRPDIDSILKFTSSKKDYSTSFTEAEKFRQNTLTKSPQIDIDDSLKFPSSKLLIFNNLPEPKNSEITLKSGISDISLNSND